MQPIWGQAKEMQLGRLRNGLVAAQEQAQNGEIDQQTAQQWFQMLGPKVQALMAEKEAAEKQAKQKQQQQFMEDHAHQTAIARQAAEHLGGVPITTVAIDPVSGRSEAMTPEFHSGGQLKGWAPLTFDAHNAEQDRRAAAEQPMPEQGESDA